MNDGIVKVGDWISVGPNRINAYVFHVWSPTEVAAGYHQNNFKAIKDDFIWDGEQWKFKYDTPCGSYLRGADEAIVKNGPFHNSHHI